MQEANRAPLERAALEHIVVHVVDDDEGIRSALAHLLVDLRCSVCTHDSAEDFLRGYEADQAACLVLDIGLPGMSGLDLLTSLTRDERQLPTVILSAASEVQHVVSAMRSGAMGFLEKPPAPEKVLGAVRDMMTLATDMAANRRRMRQLRHGHRRLTDRERDVFDLLGSGLSAKQVAHRLDISIRTAHIHRSNVMLKLGCETAVELSRIAAELRRADAPGE